MLGERYGDIHGAVSNDAMATLTITIDCGLSGLGPSLRGLARCARPVGVRASALLLACAIPPALAELPSRAAGGPPAVEGVRVSPSGEHVLAIATEEGKRAVAVIDLAGGPLTVVLQTDVQEQFLDECEWASDDRIVCSVFFFHKMGLPYPSRYRIRLVAMGRDGGERMTLLNKRPREAPLFFGQQNPIPMRGDREDPEHALVHRLPRDAQHVLIRAERDVEPYASVYRVHVRDGTAERTIRHRKGIVFWHADRTGTVRLGTGWYGVGRQFGEPFVGPTAVSVAPDGTASRLDVSRLAMPIGRRDMAGPRILGFDKEGARVYYEAAVDGAERTSVWEASAVNLEPRRQLVSDPVRDVRATAVHGTSCGVVGFMHPIGGRPFTWLDASIGADVAAAARELRQQPVTVPSMSADCQRLVLVTADGAYRRFHLLDRASGALRVLGAHRSGRTASGLERRVTNYRTRDSQAFPISVTRPTGAVAKLPVVVILDAELPPDSVERRDAWPAYFASRGYLVAKLVVRGQRGYGWSNHLAGRRLQGAKLQEDAEDALAWLEAEGLGHMRRACFMGRAAGGHLALAAALGNWESPAQAKATRCVAAYAPKNIRRFPKDPFRPFNDCLWYPCDDWMRWAASTVRERFPHASPGQQLAYVEKTTSPVVEASHPGFPVLIWTDGGTVHERESDRYRDDVSKLAYFDLLAPIGSDNEVAFLEAAEALFARVLKPSSGTN